MNPHLIHVTEIGDVHIASYEPILVTLNAPAFVRVRVQTRGERCVCAYALYECLDVAGGGVSLRSEVEHSPSCPLPYSDLAAPDCITNPDYDPCTCGLATCADSAGEEYCDHWKIVDCYYRPRKGA